jgi:hypothetical protein
MITANSRGMLTYVAVMMFVLLKRSSWCTSKYHSLEHTVILSVCAVADIIGKPESLSLVKECLTYETNVDTMLAKKMLQFKLSAAHFFRIPAGEAQDSTPIRPPRAYAIFVHEQNNGLQDSPRAGCPYVEGGYGREEPTNQLHTCLEGKFIEEIRNFLERGGGTLGGDHHVGCGLGGRGFDTRGCFLLELSSSRLSGCCRFGLGLLRPGRLPGGGHFRLLERLRDRLRRGIWIWGGVVVALTTRPSRTT